MGARYGIEVRGRAFALLGQGWSPREVAADLGVSRMVISQWRRQVGGVLREHPVCNVRYVSREERIERKRETTTIYSHASATVTNPSNGKSKTFNANTTFVDRKRSDETLASSNRGNTLFFGPVGFESDPGPAFLYVRGTTQGTTLNPSSDDAPLVFSKIKGSVVNVCGLLD